MSVEFAGVLRLGAFTYEAEFRADGEIVVLYGHSGAGKSLTLQMIAGLMTPQEGRISVNGRLVFDSASGVNVPPQGRQVGYVVQELALFPHLSVIENVTFGLRGANRLMRGQAILDALGLNGYEDRRPSTLSGGQRQRVALARALSRDVPVLLFDEPFSALDDSLRRTMRSELLRLKQELGLTILFVTHDLREAHLLADRLIVFDGGRILQDGLREEVFRRPTSRRVGELTGVANLLAAHVTAVDGDEIEVDVLGARWRAACPAWDIAEGQPVDLAIRAERIPLRRIGSTLDRTTNALASVLVRDEPYGSSHTLTFRANGAGPNLEVDIPARPYDVLGVAGVQDWLLEVAPEDIHVMRPRSAVG
ncbi:MAG: ABC transporter ATP-binding protein [Dehalococcoidia bacterium]